MKVVISQPRYLPIVNYLQRIKFADLFVFLDNVQRQYLGWENRNKLLVFGKVKWLTIPVKSSRKAKILDSQIDGYKWLKKHQKTIFYAYKHAPFFNEKFIDYYYSNVYSVLQKTAFNYSKVLAHLVINACRLFGFEPNYIFASEIIRESLKGPELLLRICQEVGAEVYISGANGRKYGVKEVFASSGIKVLFDDCIPFKYKQLNSKTFIPYLAFFDPLFNVGYEVVKEWIYSPLKLSEV